jgi:Leucine-rich repeat (LRR) protein
MFNIESYLDSLPYDIKEIDVSSKKITSLDVTRFKKLKTLECSNNQLTSLHLNEDLETLFCRDNQLTSLHLNENLKKLHCDDNQLSSLHLNKNLEKLYCSYNQLTSLQLNENLKILYCSYNQLTSLQLNKNLEILFCHNNQISCLHLNENLKTLYCYYNQLTSLHLNENLETIDYDKNPIFEIINSDDKDIVNQKLRVLNQFRYLYYSLKFKKRLRNLLWVKIREPKIREKYHYRYLLENLPDEDADLDEVLDAW